MDKLDDIGQFVQKKRSQALRLNEPELRDFEQKLRNKFVSNEQEYQIKEKTYRDLQEKVERRREANILHKIYDQQDEIKKKESQETFRSKLDYGNELQKQIKLKDVFKIQQKADEKLNEALQIERSLREKEEIDRRTAEEKEWKIQKYRNELDQFTKAKELKNKEERAIQLLEDEKISEFNKLLKQREIELAAKAKTKADVKEAIYEKIFSNLSCQKKIEEERAQLIRELQDYEYNMTKQIQDDKRMQDRDKNVFKKELMKILSMQIQAKQSKNEQLKELEMSYRKQLLEQIKMEELLASEMKMKQKLNAKHYELDLKKQIDSVAKQRENEKELIRITDCYIKQYEEEKKLQIAIEKMKLLNEYTT